MNFVELARTDIFKRIIRTKPQSEIELTVFDVGSHKGESIRQIHQTILNANHENRQLGTINFHCFEPNKKNVDTITNAGFPDGVVCIINEVAVSNKVGVVKFNIARSDTSSIENYNKRIFEFTEHRKKYKPSETIEVVSVTLDNYVKEFSVDHIDFLKIDVENHEDKVLEGAKNLLKNGKIEFVEVEGSLGSIYERQVQFYDIEKYLIPNGYQLIGMSSSHKSFYDDGNRPSSDFGAGTYLVYQYTKDKKGIKT